MEDSATVGVGTECDRDRDVHTGLRSGRLQELVSGYFDDGVGLPTYSDDSVVPFCGSRITHEPEVGLSQTLRSIHSLVRVTQPTLTVIPLAPVFITATEVVAREVSLDHRRPGLTGSQTGKR